VKQSSGPAKDSIRGRVARALAVNEVALKGRSTRVRALRHRLGLRLVGKCPLCGRPLDRAYICWYHSP
jgi:hypothetical protein